MGLLDVLNGMQNGPRGPSNPSAEASGGMSPITMAILGLAGLQGGQAYQRRRPAQAATPGAGASRNTAMPARGGGLDGGLGDLLKGGLGGLLAGGAAGSVISGGLGDLLKQFQQNGHGDAANSWVGTGPNKQIAPSDLARRWAPIRSTPDVANAACRATNCSRASASICPKWSTI